MPSERLTHLEEQLEAVQRDRTALHARQAPTEEFDPLNRLRDELVDQIAEERGGLPEVRVP